MKFRILFGLIVVILLFPNLLQAGNPPFLKNAFDVQKRVLAATVASEKEEICHHDKLSFTSYRIENPEEMQENIGYRNNKFGLYIYSVEEYIETASELVNSNGGQWGYVLIPYNVRDYNYDKWIKIFALLREEKLIPIFQLWDVDLRDFRKETVEAARFLNQFEWPIQHKYISAYNEMNDAKFWKGRLDPEGYAEILDFTADTFKDHDTNFFIMNGAFNATAPTGPGYLDQVEYMRRMNSAVPGIFGKLDGWASHSYPQPAFRGRPTDSGRASIRAYEWELSLLSSEFGVDNLPVFITETGWPHAEGEEINHAYFSEETTAKFIRQAFENVWLPDPRVVAVTPFTIYYEAPHDHFGWLDKSGKPTLQFDTVQSLPKLDGSPPIGVSSVREVLRCGIN